jgi:hypothetical protein
MAYDKKKIFEQAKEVTLKKKLFFIEDIVALLPISKQTFYDYFKVDSDELDIIKGLLEKNKIEVKNGLRNKWYNGNNPLTQMALYKLIGTEEEYHRIASTKTENKNINIDKPIFGGINLDVEENNSTG